MSVEIRYPAIAIPKQRGRFHAVGALPDRCSFRGWERGWFVGFWLFDSSGLLWQVENATPGESPGVLRKGRMIRFNLMLAPPQNNRMPDVVKRMCAMVDSDPEDLYDQFMSHAQFKKKLEAATTATELIELVCTLGDDTPAEEYAARRSDQKESKWVIAFMIALVVVIGIFFVMAVAGAF
jgi:hypothetical protein